MRGAWARFGVGVVFVATVAYGLALVENRVLWGFWFSRPTLAVELDDTITLQAMSGLDFDRRGLPAPSLDTRAKLIELAPKVCSPDNRDRDFYCLADRLVLRLNARFAPLERVPEMDPVLLGKLWEQYRTEGWHPRVESPYPGSPHLGVAIQYRKGSQPYVILGYETLQIANDRYAYAEALYQLGDPHPVLLREHRLFFEVAGAEGWETPVLAILNLLILSPGVILLSLARRKRTPLGLTVAILASLVLVAAGVWLLGRSVWGGGGTWGWRPVGMIWAFLLAGPGLLAIGIGVLRRGAKAAFPTATH